MFHSFRQCDNVDEERTSELSNNYERPNIVHYLVAGKLPATSSIFSENIQFWDQRQFLTRGGTHSPPLCPRQLPCPSPASPAGVRHGNPWEAAHAGLSITVKSWVQEDQDCYSGLQGICWTFPGRKALSLCDAANKPAPGSEVTPSLSARTLPSRNILGKAFQSQSRRRHGHEDEQNCERLGGYLSTNLKTTLEKSPKLDHKQSKEKKEKRKIKEGHPRAVRQSWSRIRVTGIPKREGKTVRCNEFLENRWPRLVGKLQLDTKV